MNEQFDIQGILKLLPHRYPFLLVDRVISFTPGESLTAIKNVTINEPFFQGHFPVKPVMPGVLMLEALAQVTGLYEFINTKTTPDANGIYYLAGIDKARFKSIVTPGDQLTLSIKLLKTKRTISRFACEAHVGSKLACTAEIMSIRQDLYTENAGYVSTAKK